jgi:rubrerythrin
VNKKLCDELDEREEQSEYTDSDDSDSEVEENHDTTKTSSEDSTKNKRKRSSRSEEEDVEMVIRPTATEPSQTDNQAPHETKKAKKHNNEESNETHTWLEHSTSRKGGVIYSCNECDKEHFRRVCDGGDDCRGDGYVYHKKSGSCNICRKSRYHEKKLTDTQ